MVEYSLINGPTHVIQGFRRMNIVDNALEFLHLHLVHLFFPEHVAGVRLRRKAILKHFFWADPGVLILAQRFDEKLFGDGCEIVTAQDALYFLPFDLLDEFFFVFGPPGSVSSEHFKEDDPNGPDISFEGILVSLERLRSHVERRSHVVFTGLQNLLGLDAKPEIGDF